MTRKNRELQYPPKKGMMEKHNSEYEFERQTEVMNNITVNESPLKVVVGEKVDMAEIDPNFHNTTEEDIASIEQYNRTIDKTLSTPLPPVEDCVEIDVEKFAKIMFDIDQSVNMEPMDWMSFGTHSIIREAYIGKANAIANSKSILKWRKVG